MKRSKVWKIIVVIHLEEQWEGCCSSHRSPQGGERVKRHDSKTSLSQSWIMCHRYPPSGSHLTTPGRGGRNREGGGENSIRHKHWSFWISLTPLGLTTADWPCAQLPQRCFPGLKDRWPPASFLPRSNIRPCRQTWAADHTDRCIRAALWVLRESQPSKTHWPSVIKHAHDQNWVYAQMCFL